MKIAILTLGTRGDVQPFVALGRRLRQEGFAVVVATGPQFEAFVTGHGLSFEPLPGDLLDLLQTLLGKSAISGRQKLTSTVRLLQAVRPMFRRLLDAQWAAVQEADSIVYHPKAAGGVHIAEKLGIPAFVALRCRACRLRAPFQARSCRSRSWVH